MNAKRFYCVAAGMLLLLPLGARAATQVIVPIADIHNNLHQYKGQMVTVQGQVYIPSNYRQSSTYSGYIQDGSGSGINVFGTTMNNPALQDIGNIVRMTATVDTFFATVELVNATSVTLVSSGNPPLTPAVLTTGAAANRFWEGTFIQVTGTVLDAPTVTSGGHNYTVSDGSGSLVVRVMDVFGLPIFTAGDHITARGAGGYITPNFQLLVGRAADCFLVGGDTTPPTLASATAFSFYTVQAVFSEAIDPVTGSAAGNYSLYPTATPAATIPIPAVTDSANTATFDLNAALAGGTSYTLAVHGVKDLAGNTMAGTQVASFIVPTGITITPIAEIQTHIHQYRGATVTVQAQVYIPSNYQGASPSGFIQDGSGYGINVSSSSMNVPDLQDIGNIVAVRAVVDTFLTTAMLVNATSVDLVSSGNPPLTPAVLTTAAAANSRYEGTFIQVTGTITGTPTMTGGAHNYTVNDGTGNLVVRVMDALGVPIFGAGNQITARGAGAYFNPDFQLLVGRAADCFLVGNDTTPPTLASASALDLNTVRAVFSEAIDPTSGGNAANFSLYPTSSPTATVPISHVSASGTLATLILSATLTRGTSYTLAAHGVRDLAGNPLSGTQTADFTSPSEGEYRTIAEIQTNLHQYKGHAVTVQGQVYIPSNYRSPATSGFIQDGSGYGINVFGSGMNVAALRDIGNIVRMTAVVDTYFATVELVNPTEVSLVSSGNPPLMPAVLTTGAAANRRYEGTFIQVTGTIAGTPTVTGGAHNYTVSDGTGSLVVRVMDVLGVPVFGAGNQITARGAGGQFNGDFQLLVGRAADCFLVNEGTTAPMLLSATAPDLNTVRAVFSEAIDTTTGGDAANYSLYPTSSPASTVPISSLSVAGAIATLTLGASLANATDYALAVHGVRDPSGKTMVGMQTVVFTTLSEAALTPLAVIQTHLRQYKGHAVTVQGQVYIPSNYRGTSTSGFIQDGSGYGINVFGSGMNVAALRDIGNIVRMTAVVDTYFTTVELVNPTTLTLVSSGNPPLAPAVLSTGAAANSRYEGTFIQVTGTIAGTPTVTGSAHNYRVSDGTGIIVVRVMDVLGVPVFGAGNQITARGAGGQFNGDFQLLVGRTADCFLDEVIGVSLGGFVAEAGAGYVELRWSAALDASAQLFVLRAALPDGPYEPVSGPLQCGVGRTEFTYKDGSVASSTEYVYRIGCEQAGRWSYSETIRVTSAGAALAWLATSPNPAAGRGQRLEFELPRTGHVRLGVYDVAGRQVRELSDGKLEAGVRTVTWDVRGRTGDLLPAGVYVMRLESGGEVRCTKIVVAR